MRWEQLANEGSRKSASANRKGGTAAGPGKRWGHSLNAVKNGKLVYLFGGYGKDDCQTNDVHVFDTVKQTWSKPLVKGTLPRPRDSHTCTTVGSKLFMFGGTDGNLPLGDLHILDTVTNTWTRPVTSGETPAPREGHSAALINDELYVFGGCGKTRDYTNEVYFNDLYVLNTASLVWRKIATAGTPPSPRDSHSCSSYKNNFIVCGGEDPSNTYLADVHILDVETMKWRKLETSGSHFSPRAGHTANCIGNNFFVFGGFTDNRKLFNDIHFLDILTGVWTKAIPTGKGPSPRFSLASDLTDAEKGIVLLYGGCNEKLEALPEMYNLHADMGIPTQEDSTVRAQVSLQKEVKIKQPETLASPSMSGSEKDIPKLKKQKPVSPTSPLLAEEYPSAYDVKPVAEKLFEGKITSIFHYGYTLEANIEGKPFRGVLFSYKPGFTHAVHAYLTRKKMAEEVNAAERMKEKESIEQASENENDVYYPQMTDVQPPIMPEQYRQLLGSGTNPFLHELASLP